MEEKRTKNLAAMDALLVGRAPDQTAPSFRSPGSLLLRVGLVWLMCALVLLYGEGGDLWSFLYPNLYPVFGLLGEADILVCSGVKLFLGCFLVVQCVLWQRRKQAGDLYGRDRKLLNGWQVSIVIFCLLYALTAVGIWVGSPVPYVIPQVAGGQSDGFLMSLCLWLRNLLPLLVPVLPLLLTGIRGKDRCLTALSGVLLLLYVGYLGMAVAYWVQGTGELPSYLLYANLVYPFLKYLAAPVSLLAAAGRLGREFC